MSNKPDEVFDPDEVEDVEGIIEKPSEEIEVVDESELEALVPEGFVVNDEDSANWVIRKIVERRQRALRMKETRKRALSEMNLQFKEADFFFFKYRDQLAAFATTQLTGKRKSAKFLEGVMGWKAKTTPARLTMIDEDAAVKWARAELPEAVKIEIVYRLDQNAVWDHFKTNGDLPPGFEFTAEKTENEFYVK